MTKQCLNVGFCDIFRLKRYRRATFVGCILAINQMTSGMNCLIYFSNILFATHLPPTEVTFLVGLFNFLATVLGVVLISKFGRRSLMLFSNFWMTILLFLVGWSLLKGF